MAMGGKYVNHWIRTAGTTLVMPIAPHSTASQNL